MPERPRTAGAEGKRKGRGGGGARPSSAGVVREAAVGGGGGGGERRVYVPTGGHGGDAEGNGGGRPRSSREGGAGLAEVGGASEVVETNAVSQSESHRSRTVTGGKEAEAHNGDGGGACGEGGGRAEGVGGGCDVAASCGGVGSTEMQGGAAMMPGDAMAGGDDELRALLSRGRKARAELAHLTRGGMVCGMRLLTRPTGEDVDGEVPCHSGGGGGEGLGREGVQCAEGTPSLGASRRCEGGTPLTEQGGTPPGGGRRGAALMAGEARPAIRVSSPPAIFGAAYVPRDGASCCSTEGIAGGLERVVSHLRARGVQSTSAAATGCRVVASLAVHPTNRLAAARMGCVEGVLGGMRAHPGSREVQEAGCSAVAWLCGHEVVRAEFRDAGAAGAVERAVLAHKGCSKVVAEACRALLGLAGVREGVEGGGQVPRVCAAGQMQLGRRGEVVALLRKVVEGTGDDWGCSEQARELCREVLSLSSFAEL